METYNRNEKIDMVLIYGECLQNTTQAARVYADRFPERRHPSRHYFPRLVQKLRNEPEPEEEQIIINQDKEIDVLAYVEAYKTASLREIALECAITVSSAWRILHKYKYHSFKYQIHQHLYEDDFARRLKYCNWFLDKNNVDPTFPCNILYSDESRFTNLGMFNRNNKRYWAQDNLHLMQEGNFQARFGFNCWLGIIGGRIIGPIFFDGHLTGERYLQFLRNEIEQFLDELPLQDRINIIFQQDGAPAHNARAVQEHLNDRFGENWIGTTGPVRWPPRSPDITPLDFFAWGTIKNEVYNTPPATREELENRVRAAINKITRENLQNVVRKTIQNVRACQEAQGRHFEQLD